MTLPDDAKDIMTKWTTPPIVAENEQLKARVLELEAEIAELAGLIPSLMPIPASRAFRDGWVAGVKAYREAVRERVFREAKP